MPQFRRARSCAMTIGRLKFPARRWILAGTLAWVAVAVGFTLGRVVLTDETATAQPGAQPAGAPGQRTPPVDPDATPPPGATPDTSQPLWYVPYLNRNRDFPEFDGELNGIKIHLHARAGDPNPRGCGGSFEVALGDAALQAAVSAGLISESFDIPGAVPAENRPILELCDGKPQFFQQLYSFPPDHARANRGGGYAEIQVLVGSDTAHIGQPEERWTTGSVKGLPAAFLRPILETPVLGDSAVLVLRPGPVLLQVVCAEASLSLCQDVAAEVLP